MGKIFSNLQAPSIRPAFFPAFLTFPHGLPSNIPPSKIRSWTPQVPGFASIHPEPELHFHEHAGDARLSFSFEFEMHVFSFLLDGAGLLNNISKNCHPLDPARSYLPEALKPAPIPHLYAPDTNNWSPVLLKIRLLRFRPSIHGTLQN